MHTGSDPSNCARTGTPAKGAAAVEQLGHIAQEHLVGQQAARDADELRHAPVHAPTRVSTSRNTKSKSPSIGASNKVIPMHPWVVHVPGAQANHFKPKKRL